MSGVRQLCTFFLDDFYFGVDVHKVQEVLLHQEMTRVPLAPRIVRGLINLRGNIVTAIDMRRRLDLPEFPADRRPMNVVIRTADGPVSLLVDEIGDVIEVDSGSYERPPETLRGPARDLIQGAYKLDRRLLLALNSERAVCVESVAQN